MKQQPFRPGFETLEDRTVPSISGLHSGHVLPAQFHLGNPIRQVQQAVNNAVHQAQQVEHALQQQAAHAGNRINHDANEFAQQVRQGASAARRKLLQFGNQATRQAVALFHRLGHVTAYDFTTHGTLTANFQTGTYYANLGVGSGVSLDTNQLQTLLAGQVPLPNIDVVTGALEALVGEPIVSSSYDAVRNSYLDQGAPGSTYFSSERFVDWASPSTLAKYAAAVGAVVATGGTASPALEGILNDAQGQLLLELNDIYAWLRNDGISIATTYAGDLLGGIVRAVIEGTSVSVNAARVRISIQLVQLPETVSVQLGTSQLPGVGSLLGNFHRTVLTGTEPHLGFAITIGGPSPNPDPYGSAVTAFDASKFTSEGVIGANFPAILQEALAQASDPRVREALSLLNDANFTAEYASNAAGDALFSALHLSTSQLLSAYQRGNPIVDLTNTGVADTLRAQVLDKLALGNAGGAHFDQLQFNLETDELTMKVSLHYALSLQTAGELLGAVKHFVQQQVATLGREMRTVGNQVSAQLKGLGHRIVAQTKTEIRVLGHTIHALLPQFEGAISRGFSPGQVVQEVRQAAQTVINTSQNTVTATVEDTKQAAGNAYQQGKQVVSGFLGL